jgi:NADP-dependent 3-hydroxy acid dehydrogenase YdfG
MRTSNLDINLIADSVVVITGASSGMGKEITYRYAERGCKIVIGSRNLKELTAVSI